MSRRDFIRDGLAGRSRRERRMHRSPPLFYRIGIATRNFDGSMIHGVSSATRDSVFANYAYQIRSLSLSLSLSLSFSFLFSCPAVVPFDGTRELTAVSSCIALCISATDKLDRVFFSVCGKSHRSPEKVVNCRIIVNAFPVPAKYRVIISMTMQRQ